MNEHNYMVKHFFLTISLFFILLGKSYSLIASDEYSLVQISYTQGLSNSAVLSLHKDSQGFMWFGTYDGLDRYSGKKMEVFRTDMPLGAPLLNNSIYGIETAGNDLLWISTSGGVNCFSLKKKQVVGTYQSFKESFQLFSNQKGNTWVIDKEYIYHYFSQKDSFVALSPNTQSVDKNLYLVDEEGRLWQFSENTNQVYFYEILSDGSLSTDTSSIHSKRIIFSYYQGGTLNFVDEDYDLFLYDIKKSQKIYIRNVGTLIQRYGRMKGIIVFRDDIVLAFQQNGLIKLDAAARYSESVIDDSFRVFSIYKDPVQDIIWVGTDGQGVFAYSAKKKLANHLMFNQLQNKISRQVRSIYTDTLGNLWFGTKGDGLVKVANYQDNMQNRMDFQDVAIYFPEGKKLLLDYNRRLSEFQVFGISPSRYKNGFWLGSADNPALSFYDYQRDAVYSVKGDISLIQKVHQIYEENDSILWMTTSGSGLCQVVMKQLGDGTLKAVRVKQFIFKDGKKGIYDFFPMSVEGDSVMWLGSRGMGLVRFNFQTESYKIYLLGGKDKFSVNDVLSICLDGKKLYLGTVSGLVQLEIDSQGNAITSYIGKEQGLLNDMVHGILKDENGFLWLSTNKGLVKYNPINQVFHTFYYTNGLQIGEFSDDAFYQCGQTGRLFFGGVDGLLFLTEEQMDKIDYHPSIAFCDLEVQGESVPFYDYYDEMSQTLVLKGISSAFSVSFIALDFVEGDNFQYSYRIDDGPWSPFATKNIANLKSLSYGKHLLEVKYKRNVFDSDYVSNVLVIDILPPWYLSIWAYCVYFMLLVAGCAYLVRLVKRYFHRERLIKELMVHEAYNTNNIGSHFHEFIGSYSTICQACGELRKLPNMSEDYYRKLDSIYESILSCVFKSNKSIQSSIDLGNFFPNNQTVYGPVNISNISNEVIRILIQHGYNNLSDLYVDIQDNLSPVLSEDAFRYLIYFIYQQALRGNKPVTVTIAQKEMDLEIRAEMSADACQYILDISKQTEICLDSDLESYVDTWLFIYAIRGLNISFSIQEQYLCVIIPLLGEESSVEKHIVQDRKTVLLLEDRISIAWLIKEILHEQYAVTTVATLQEAFSYLRKQTPDVFLADTLIYLSEEHKFFDYIQANKGVLMHLIFIPLVTWKAVSLLDELSNNLIDGFIVMPYDLLFLQKKIDIIISRAGDKKSMLMELLEDVNSAKKEIPVEQNEFIKQIMKVLDENLDREDLGSSFLAERMSMSSRQFYRKFKELAGNSPSEFIKSYRIEKAVRLLEETNLSVSEVISEVGISSHSYFYKEFSYKYGMTPKEYRELKKRGKIEKDDIQLDA